MGGFLGLSLACPFWSSLYQLARFNFSPAKVSRSQDFPGVRTIFKNLP